MKFSDSIKKTLQIFRGVTYFQTSKSSSGVLYTYDDIPLKLYIDIAKTGDFLKLVKSGRVGNDECLLEWEKLIKRQQKESGSSQYSAVFRLSKGYLLHLNDHNMIRACLILVGLNHCYVDWEYIKILKDKGYQIDTSTPERILETVKEGLHRCENLITRAVSKRKELDLILKQSESGTKESAGFEQILANLNYHWPNPVSEDIKLCTYNEYQKILKAKLKASENGRNQ